MYDMNIIKEGFNRYIPFGKQALCTQYAEDGAIDKIFDSCSADVYNGMNSKFDEWVFELCKFIKECSSNTKLIEEECIWSVCTDATAVVGVSTQNLDALCYDFMFSGKGYCQALFRLEDAINLAIKIGARGIVMQPHFKQHLNKIFGKTNIHGVDVYFDKRDVINANYENL